MQDQPNPSDKIKQDIYDLTGDTFGPVTVVKLDHIDPVQGRRMWLIRCECGTESIRPANEFRKKAPPCNGCKLIELRKEIQRSGLITPDWMIDLGFNESFIYRLLYRCKHGPVPPHRPELGPCLIWPGAVTSRGRGSIRIGSNDLTISVHRAAYIYGSGKQIPDDPEHDCVLHKCDVPRCIRFDHLFLGNDQINQEDMIEKGRARHPSGDEHWNRKLTNAMLIRGSNLI